MQPERNIQVRAVFRPDEVEASVPFDYEAVAQALGEPLEELPNAAEIARVTAMLRKIIRWVCLKNEVRVRRPVQMMAQRLTAMAWILTPEDCGGQSQASVARNLGFTPQSVAKQAGEFSRAFRIRSPGQKHSNGTWKPRIVRRAVKKEKAQALC